jgi:hypothetical protein
LLWLWFHLSMMMAPVVEHPVVLALLKIPQLWK